MIDHVHPAHHETCGAGHHDDEPSSERMRDPVCGMMVDPALTPHRAEVETHPVFFCSAGCRTRFLADPARYRAPPEERAKASPVRDAVYTCPMHPEVEQVGPGACPFCGMALEPKEVTVEVGPNHELVDMTRRLWIGACMALPVVLVAMGGHLLRLDDLAPPRMRHWVELVLSSVVVLWAGAPFFVRGWRSLQSRNLNMFTLIAIGTGVAWLESVAATVAPSLFPADFRMADGTVPVYSEAAAVIVVLALLGQVLELRARDETGSAIRRLLGLVPPLARRIDADGCENEVPLDHVSVGDRLRLKPGEQVPVDGIVIEGRSSLDEAMVTGESMPVSKAPGDAVVGGTMNRSGSLVIEARKVGGDTLLAQIVRGVADAQRSRAPIQRVADRVSGAFVPAVLAAAALTFVVWATVGPEPRFAHGLVAAISVMIIACPCALGLATPLSIMVGMGRGASAGILIRDAEVLERLEKVDTLVMDKTGTLTKGRPAVVRVVPATGYEAADVLRLAAAVERRSEHPLAEAILGAVADEAERLPEVTDFEAPAGAGVSGLVAGRRIGVGSQAHAEQGGGDVAGLAAEADHARNEGATAVFVTIDGIVAGLIAIADPLKPEAAAVIDALRRRGLRVTMLTGDHRRTAEAVARNLHLDDIEAEVLPNDKSRIVGELKSRGRVVAMVGDGVNDAPALAAADVGIAMGTGTDIAKESAGVTLLGGDLRGLPRATLLSRKVMANIRQNLTFAFAYNLVGVPVAAGLLYPGFHLLLSPEIAAAAMALSSVSVVGNALRLRALRLD